MKYVRLIKSCFNEEGGTEQKSCRISEMKKNKISKMKILQGNNFSSKVTQLPISKKTISKCKLSDNYTHVSAFKRWHNNSLSMRWDLKGASAKAQRWQKCPQSLKIVDSVNKKCQLRWRVGGGVGRGGGWSVQNVDRDRKWPGNWTRNTNEPVPERRHSKSEGLKLVL